MTLIMTNTDNNHNKHGNSSDNNAISLGCSILSMSIMMTITVNNEISNDDNNNNNDNHDNNSKNNNNHNNNNQQQ